MKTYHRLFVVAALLALGAACWSGLGSAAQEKGKEDKAVAKPDSSKWEYKIAHWTDDEMSKEMNRLGDEGWELVATTSEVSAFGKAQGSSPISTKVRLIFKKPKK